MKIDETYFSGHDTDDSLEALEQPVVSYPVYVGTVVLDPDLKKIISREEFMKHYFGIAKNIQALIASSRVVTSVSEPLCFVDDENIPGRECVIETVGGLPVLSEKGWRGYTSFDFGCGFSIQKKPSKTAIFTLIKNIIVYISHRRDIINHNSPMRIIFFVDGPLQIINVFNTLELVTSG